MAPSFRECRPGDLSKVAALLARAFHSDPLLNYILADSKRPHEAKEVYFRFCFQTSQIRVMGNGEEAAALWVAPEAKVGLMNQLTLIPAIVRTMGVKSIPKCVRAMMASERSHPKRKHFYLMAVGVDPRFQGQGIGTKIIRQTLIECDRARVPVYLDTSNPRNLPLYERLGFKITGEVRSSSKAPPLWTMWRETPS